jgi:hypothetical protein
MVGAGIEVIAALADDGDSVGVLVAREETSIETTVVWFGDWKPEDAAKDDGALAVVAGGTMTLVLFSVNRGTELTELLDIEERMLELVDIKFVADGLGVSFGSPAEPPSDELELLGTVMEVNADELDVVVSDCVVGEAVVAAPSPVACTSGFDKVVLVAGERSPFGFAPEGVRDELLEDPELLAVASAEVEGGCEVFWEVEELILLDDDSIVENDDNGIEELEDNEDVEDDDKVGVGVFVIFDSVVVPTGIIVRTSGIEEELDDCVVLEKGTALATLHMLAGRGCRGRLAYCLRSSYLRSGPAALRTAKKSALDTR